MEIKGWLISTSDDGAYLYIERGSEPGQIHIKVEEEGFVVDIWSNGDDAQCVASAWATYTDLEEDSKGELK